MMMVDAQKQNAQDLEADLVWFSRLLDARFKPYLKPDSPDLERADLTPPDLSGSDSPYATIVTHYDLSFEERTALVLSLVPHIRPQLLDVFFTKNKTYDRKFAEFGGLRNGPDGDFVPTGETLLFILAGDDLGHALRCKRSFTGITSLPGTTSCA